MAKRGQDDADWTPTPSSSKTKWLPSPVEGTCILHGNKGKVSEKLIYLSSKREPYTVFNEILDIKTKLLTQVSDCGGLQNVCEAIPNVMSRGCGYHESCRRDFFRIGRRTLSSIRTNTASKRTSRQQEDDAVIFGNYCIFCKGDNRKKVSGNRYGLQKFHSDAYKNIEEKAVELNDENLLCKIRGIDLFAREAQFHDCCRKQYLVRRVPQQCYTTTETEEVSEKKRNIDKAFSHVYDLLKKEVIHNGQVLKLCHLRNVYNENLANTKNNKQACEITSHNLRLKIEHCSDLKDSIGFSSAPYKDTLVFCNSSESLKTIVRSAYDLGASDWIKEVSLELHTKILKAFKETKPLLWPTKASDVPDPLEEIPADILQFVSTLICGKREPSDRERILVISISQDICKAVTGGQWKMKKHILLCMTLRHLFRSKKLTTLLNKLGHCESYTYSLELETALANSIVESTSVISNTDVVKDQPEGAVFHSDWDNFDQLVSDVYGAGSVHTAVGIYMQDLGFCKEDDGLKAVPSTSEFIPDTQPKKKQRTFKSPPQELAPYYQRKRSEPTLMVSLNCDENCSIKGIDLQDSDLLWMIARHVHSEDQVIPGISGWVSGTGNTPKCTTKIGYYPMINAAITDLKTIQECLKCSQEASSEAGQDYTITTFDLGVCMKAFPLIWNEPEKYKHHIILIGTFHICGAYLKGIGSRYCQGSGWMEVAMEAKLITSGSVAGVVNGKNWDRALNTHKSMLEALERLLYQEYLETHEPLSQKDLTLLQELRMNDSSVSAVLASNDIHDHLVKYQIFRQAVSNGELGETGRFWIEYMDCVWLVLSLNNAIKRNDYDRYKHIISIMPDLFFCSDQQNYARYLTYFSYFLEHIEETHPGSEKLLRAGTISVARSKVPGNRCHTDKTIEETAMRWLKSTSGSGTYSTGIKGITSNIDASQRHILTAHAKGEFVEAMWTMVSRPSELSVDQQRDLRPHEIIRSEKQVQRTVKSIQSFINPFQLESSQPLTCLSSGAAMPEEVRHDVLNALSKGQLQKENFVNNRLINKNVSFFEPIKRNKFKTMSSTAVSQRIVTAKKKEIQYKSTSGFIFQVLVKAQQQEKHVSIGDLMSYPLSPTPYAIATLDGYFAKTNKAQGMNYMIKDVENGKLPPSNECALIQDGNSSFYMKDVPHTMQAISERIFQCLPAAAVTIFSTDTYADRLLSPKSAERDRRGCGDRFIIEGLNIHRPVDWKTFLTNDDNKKSFISLLHRHWSSADMTERILKKPTIFIEGGQAYKLTVAEGETLNQYLPEICSSHEETDVRLIIYINYIQTKLPHIKTVRVRAKDSDIFFILLYYAKSFTVSILLDMGERLINMNQLAENYSQDHITALLSLHAFTGADCTSAFKGKGKIRSIKLLNQNSKFIDIFAKVGNQWVLDDEIVLGGIEEFTCRLYGCSPRIKNVNEAREIRAKKISGSSLALRPTVTFDLAKFPPCKRVLVQHVKRVNYQVCVWRRAYEQYPKIPLPQEFGFHINSDTNKLEPLWFEGEIIPKDLLSVLVDDEGDEANCDDLNMSDDNDNYDNDDDRDADDESDSD